jgi:hypothetical protein
MSRDESASESTPTYTMGYGPEFRKMLRNVRCGVFRRRPADLWQPDIDCLTPTG